MIYKKILLISLLTFTNQQFGVITIVNHTPWPEIIFFENKYTNKIGRILLKANEGICFAKYSHPILKTTVAITRKLKIWELPQDSNPGEPERPIITMRQEALTDADVLDYATPCFLHITTLFPAEFQTNITLHTLSTKESSKPRYPAKYVNLHKYITPIL